MTDRQWTDADLALILPHMHAPDLDDDADRQERAEAVLDALTTAGWRPAADQQISRDQRRVADLKRDRDSLHARWTIRRGEAERLRARMAELEQQLADRSCRMCHGSHLVHDGMGAGPCPACSVDGRPVPGWERQFCGTSADRWEMPPDPGPETTEVWDREGVRWTRTAPLTWTRADEPHDPWWCRWWWVRLVARRGPLSAAPPETAGGDPDA